MKWSRILSHGILLYFACVVTTQSQWANDGGYSTVFLNGPYASYNVGVAAGDHNPSQYSILAKLHVAGDMLVANTGMTQGAYLGSGNLHIAGSGSGLNIWKQGLTDLSNSTNPGNRWYFYNPDSSLRFFTGTTGDVMTINPSGNIGIGSSSNLAVKLTVNAHSYPTIRIRTDSVKSTGQSILGTIDFTDNDQPGYAEARVSAVRSAVGGSTNSKPSDLVFYLDSANTTLNERMRIDYRGDVGLGISSPKNRLDLAGGMVIGRDSAGIVTAPANGLMVEGNVGIGTSNVGSAQLAVNGKIEAREVSVTATSPFPDFVFSNQYKAMPLDKLEQSIREHRHLPGVPSANEVRERGLNVGDMEVKLLQKVEELTLYVIDLKKENDTLKGKMAVLRGK